jgi:hypothetical protein
MSFGYSPGTAGKTGVEPTGQRGLLLPWSGNARMAGPVSVNGSEWLYLPGTPWSLRLANGRRPALEVYAAGSLIDVMVASSRASRLLHGACRAAAGRQASTMAWGCLPAPRDELPSVEFIRGRIRRRAQPAEAESVVGWFWLAEADGRFSEVVVTSEGERESCWISAADRCLLDGKPRCRCRRGRACTSGQSSFAVLNRASIPRSSPSGRSRARRARPRARTTPRIGRTARS